MWNLHGIGGEAPIKCSYTLGHGNSWLLCLLLNITCVQQHSQCAFCNMCAHDTCHIYITWACQCIFLPLPIAIAQLRFHSESNAITSIVCPCTDQFSKLNSEQAQTRLGLSSDSKLRIEWQFLPFKFLLSFPLFSDSKWVTRSPHKCSESQILRGGESKALLGIGMCGRWLQRIQRIQGRVPRRCWSQFLHCCCDVSSVCASGAYILQKDFTTEQRKAYRHIERNDFDRAFQLGNISTKNGQHVTQAKGCFIQMRRISQSSGM